MILVKAERPILFAFALFTATACSDDEKKGTADPTDSGGSGSGGSAGQDDGGNQEAAVPGDTLCAKYGGPDNIMTVMKTNVLGAIAADCRVNSFFVDLSPAMLTHIGDCLGNMAQELFACPGVHYAGSTSSGGDECRDMRAAHAGLDISQGDFDALIEDVVAGLSEAGVEEDDIMAAAPALLGMQGDIVESAATDPSEAMCMPPDGGTTDAGPSDAADGG